jgi:hypothetical protein
MNVLKRKFGFFLDRPHIYSPATYCDMTAGTHKHRNVGTAEISGK